MKVVILAGGLGTRLSEETEVRPKPMVEIGGKPILWHIMKLYAHYGYNEFYVALGYKSDYIKRFFVDYCNYNGSMTIDLGSGRVEAHDRECENWVVNLVDTGLNTQTGGRLKRLARWLGNETFMMTYGDGVANIDLRKLLEFHRSHGKLATVTAVHPPSRFGDLHFEGISVKQFAEKPQLGEGWISGGFFVLEPAVLDAIEGDATPFEADPLQRIVRRGQLCAYAHDSFWQCMDTLRDVRYLESLWQGGQAPWRVWG